MIPSTSGFGWGGVLCWDGVSGCRVCGGVNKDWGEVDGELGGGGVLGDMGVASCLWSGVGWNRVGWIDWSRWE